MFAFCLILGAIVFLIMVHPVIFWLVFVPLTILVTVGFIGWLKK